MPGFAAIIGAAPDDETAVNIVREIQEKNILTFLSGHTNGDSVTRQLQRQGVELGWDTRIVPLGPETEHTLYALDWAIRASLIFGGLKPGDYKGNLMYMKDRVFAFAIALGEMDDMLLRKVEELTLYVIELKKENEAQSKEINELKSKLDR